MSITNLREKYPKLIMQMEGSGYSRDYINRVRREIEHMLKLVDEGIVSSYTDVYREYEKIGASSDRLARKQGLIFLIEQFDIDGQISNGARRPQTLSQGAYHQLCDEYKAIIDYYVKAETKRGKKSVSIDNESNVGAAFLLHLQQSGSTALSDVTEADVLSFFSLTNGEIVHCAYKKPITALLKACVSGFSLCERLLAYLPILRPNHRNVQYLIDEEIAKIKAVLSDAGSGVSLRDKAIITVALYTGLRSGDIAGMTVGSIDWDNDLLHICQQKTEVPLTLPLSAVVGNAIFEYMNNERPISEHEHVFIANTMPYGKITNVAICGIVKKFMKEAGIRQKSGDRQGLHVFRHHVATALLGNGVPRPIISSAIGHTSPNSLDPYLSADFPHLKNCAISVERYPLADSVFTLPNKYVSCFAPIIESFLSYRRVSENWRSGTYEPNLLIFDRYCKGHYPDAESPSQEMIDNWCEQRDTESNNSCRTRINAVTALVQYARERGHANLMPPVAPRTERSPYIPHAFTDEELIKFFEACDNLTGIESPAGRSRRITVPVFFRLLYSSGIRTTEARLLRTDDVDLEHGIINVRLTKGYRQHFIALHDSMVELLRKYDVAIKGIYALRAYFFPASENKCHTADWAEKNFRECWFKGNKAHAIPYELRHHYATTNINSWIEDGFGFDAKFLYLSKSMGHSVIESTKYYYSLIPRLSTILEDMTNADFEAIVPEVEYEEID